MCGKNTETVTNLKSVPSRFVSVQKLLKHKSILDTQEAWTTTWFSNKIFNFEAVYSQGFIFWNSLWRSPFIPVGKNRSKIQLHLFNSTI